MENDKKFAADGEIHLPREIIHHIQSFLNEREAARMSILSKSWYSAWSTRPNLAFEPECSDRLKKTMQRYEDQNIKIQSFKVKQLNHNRDFSHAREFIAKAMNLGADDIYISILNSSFVLPDEVLESKTLARLNLFGLTVNLPKSKKGLTFSKLKTLDLSYLTVKGDIFRDLISKCPSIEKLKMNVIRSFSRDDRLIRLCMNDFKKLELPNLEFLFLSHLEFEGVLSSPKLWARFSCLKELVIWDNYDKKDVRICSRSLERLNIYLIGNQILNAEFDVPNLRMFKLRASPLSRLDFKTSKGWESDVHVICYEITPSWFSSLNQFLKALRSSRVSLSIYLNVSLKDEESGDGFRCVGDSVVETLRLKGEEVNSEFLDNLFSICRPKSIIQDCVLLYPMKKELMEVEVDCKKMVDEVMNVKLLEERFGKYSSLSSKKTLFQYSTTFFRLLFLHKVIWNLEH